MDKSYKNEPVVVTSPYCEKNALLPSLPMRTSHECEPVEWTAVKDILVDFVPAEDEQITNNEFFGTDEPAGAFTFGKDEPVDSKIDTALNLEAESQIGK